MSTVDSTKSVDQATTSQVVKDVNKITDIGGTDFDSILKANLTPGQDNKVSEEELFAAVIPERLKTLKGDDVAAQYKELLSQRIASSTKPDGYIPFEQAAQSSLQDLVKSGVVTKEEGDKIYSEAFAASQLDSDTNLLYDDRGGGKDITIAVADLESALLAARTKTESFDTGDATPQTRILTPEMITPDGTNVDGPDGFLFKPISDGDGKLAVLAPEKFSYDVAAVYLKDADGNLIEQGRFTSFGDDGSRAKFSFTMPGVMYPKDAIVEFALKDGSLLDYKIPDPSQRYD